MVGFLDGDGYTVSGINISGGFLFSALYNFTFKNIGLDIVKSGAYFLGQSIAASGGDKANAATVHLNNCWFNYTGASASFAHIGGLFGSATNLVINYQTTTADGFFRASYPASYSNVLGIAYKTDSAKEALIFPAKTTATLTAKNCVQFESLELASANLLGETPSFDTSVFKTTEMQEYWVIGANGFPVWKNA